MPRQRVRSLAAVAGSAFLATLASCDTTARRNDAERPDPPIAIIGATIIPMTDAAATDEPHVTRLRNTTVLVRSGHIVSVGGSDSVAVPPEAVRIDGRGRFVIPALVDAHVHFNGRGSASELPVYLANGVATVRNMQGENYHLRWRGEIASGARLGPNLYTTGPFSDGVRSVVAARAFVHATREEGYDEVKFHLPLPDSLYDAILAAAREEGIPVVGHTPGGPRGVSVAARAGQQTIEHAESIMQNDADERAPDSADIARIVASIRGSGVCVTPTLVRFDHVIRMTKEPDALANFNRQFAWMRALVAALAAADVPLLAGTDAPFARAAPGSSLHEELRLLISSGLSPYAALHAATADAARCFGHDRQFGVVRAGARADLLVVASDPLLDITVVAHPLEVIVRGRRVTDETRSRLRPASR